MKVRLTLSVTANVVGMPRIQHNQVQSALNEVLSIWSDGRYLLHVELLQESIAKILESGIRQAVLIETHATIPEGDYDPTAKSWTHPAVIETQRRCQNLQICKVDEPQLLKLDVIP